MARYDRGWVKIYRTLTHPENDIGSNGHRLAILITLIAWANRDSSTVQWNGKPRKIQRGQVIIGIRDFSAHLRFSKDTVWRQINYLCERDTLRKETATEGTLITILKYDEYQENSKGQRQECDKDETLTGRDLGRQPNARQYPNREVKKEESKNRSFDWIALYKKYPRKEGRQEGLKRCADQIKNQSDYDALSIAIDKYAIHCHKTNQLVRHFSTFLGTKSSGFPWRDWTDPEAGLVKFQTGPAVGGPNEQELARNAEELKQNRITSTHQDTGGEDVTH